MYVSYLTDVYCTSVCIGDVALYVLWQVFANDDPPQSPLHLPSSLLTLPRKNIGHFKRLAIFLRNFKYSWQFKVKIGRLKILLYLLCARSSTTLTQLTLSTIELRSLKAPQDYTDGGSERAPIVEASVTFCSRGWPAALQSLLRHWFWGSPKVDWKGTLYFCMFGLLYLLTLPLSADWRRCKWKPQTFP